jgi:hypothetical protein
MGQLALGPLSYSQYQNDLFWIQQCHLTIGAAMFPPPIMPFERARRFPARPRHVLCAPCAPLSAAALGELRSRGSSPCGCRAKTLFQVIWAVVGVQSACSCLLSVVAASNVSTASWHPLPLVLTVVILGSTAHGLLTTCTHFPTSACSFVLSRCSSPHLATHLCHALGRGIFVLRQPDVAVVEVALVRTHITSLISSGSFHVLTCRCAHTCAYPRCAGREMK